MAINKRLGVIVPSGNVIMEPDMYRLAPDGITVHFSRAVITEDSPEQLERMVDDVPRCCRELSHGNMDVYAFGCTGGSFLKGVGYDQEIIGIMEKETGKPATTASTAVVDALRHLDVRRIAIASPYEEWLNERARIFFEGNGFEVVAIQGLGIRDTEGLAAQEPETIFHLAEEVDRPEAEAIFISCTDFRAVEALARIENALHKPVVSSNQATMWKMLQMVGIQEGRTGYGRLMTAQG
jgi:maleate cis-trans isomerase